MPEPAKSPDALDTSARACTAPLMDDACTSPPNSDSEASSAAALAVGVCPGTAEAEAAEAPHETMSALG